MVTAMDGAQLARINCVKTPIDFPPSPSHHGSCITVRYFCGLQLAIHGFMLAGALFCSFASFPMLAILAGKVVFKRLLEFLLV